MNLPVHLRKGALNKVSDESLQHVHDVNEDKIQLLLASLTDKKITSNE